MEEMKFSELSEKNQELIKKELEKEVKNVDYSEVVISPKSSNEKLVIKYKNLTITVPIHEPDQSTANTIWTILATGVVCIGTAATVLFLNKSKS